MKKLDEKSYMQIMDVNLPFRWKLNYLNNNNNNNKYANICINFLTCFRFIFVLNLIIKFGEHK
jgi:hypothetical protein